MRAPSRLLLLAASLMLAGGALWALAFGEPQAPRPAGLTPRVEVTLVKVVPVRR